MNAFKLIGALIALIIAGIFTFAFPGSGAEGIVVAVAGAIFTYFGWDWRQQYLDVQAWVKSKTLWGVVIVFVPILGFVIALIFVVDLNTVMIFGFSLKAIFDWLLSMGGGLFLLGAAHAGVKKRAA